MHKALALSMWCYGARYKPSPRLVRNSGKHIANNGRLQKAIRTYRWALAVSGLLTHGAATLTARA